MKFTIYQVHNGEKHYYIGDSTWTSDYKKAAIYDKIPQFNWMISHHYIETTKYEQVINIEIAPSDKLPYEVVYNRKQYEVVSQTGEKIGNTIDIINNVAYVIFKNNYTAERMRALQHNLQLFVAGPVEERKRVVVTLFTLGPKLENKQTPVLSDEQLNEAAKRTAQKYCCKPFLDKRGVVMSDKMMINQDEQKKIDDEMNMKARELFESFGPQKSYILIQNLQSLIDDDVFQK